MSRQKKGASVVAARFNLSVVHCKASAVVTNASSQLVCDDFCFSMLPHGYSVNHQTILEAVRVEMRGSTHMA